MALWIPLTIPDLILLPNLFLVSSQSYYSLSIYLWLISDTYLLVDSSYGYLWTPAINLKVSINYSPGISSSLLLSSSSSMP